jgi:tripeptide aminopeptidase
VSVRSKSDLRSRCLQRFLGYVTVDTRSEEDSETFPSTAKQLDLLRRLRDELRAIGLDDASMDEHGYVFATVPATSKKVGVPVLGLIAHVDTSPEVSGEGVKPIVHGTYDGRDLVLPDDPTQVIRVSENPALAGQIGNDIVTASGTTLLGADNKAGVAEIVTAAEYLVAHPEIPHGKIRIGFTPDEEVGNGTKHFDVERFGARFAYTVDGETLGEIEMETFSADAMTVTFQGFNTHPGLGKGKLVNAIKIAADFIGRLPKDGLSPETTEGYEGYVHPYVVQAGVDRASVKFLIRDFVTAGLADKERFLEKIARETVSAYPKASVECKVDESYRNMKEVLDRYPEAVENANEAIRRAGLSPVMHPIRGGTDGSRLCFMGLPTPNLFAGEHNFHSRLEWVSAQDMEKAVEVILHLCRVWEEKSPA